MASWTCSRGHTLAFRKVELGFDSPPLVACFGFKSFSVTSYVYIMMLVLCDTGQVPTGGMFKVCERGGTDGWVDGLSERRCW